MILNIKKIYRLSPIKRPIYFSLKNFFITLIKLKKYNSDLQLNFKKLKLVRNIKKIIIKKYVFQMIIFQNYIYIKIKI